MLKFLTSLICACVTAAVAYRFAVFGLCVLHFDYASAVQLHTNLGKAVVIDIFAIIALTALAIEISPQARSTFVRVGILILMPSTGITALWFHFVYIAGATYAQALEITLWIGFLPAVFAETAAVTIFTIVQWALDKK